MRHATCLAIIVIVLLSAFRAGAADKPSPGKVQPMKDLTSVMPTHGTASVKPADRWEFAFVSGNGVMGAMAFGVPHDETIVANHARLFLPLGTREVLPDMAGYLSQLRRVIREKGYGDPRRSSSSPAMAFYLGKAKKQGYPGLRWTDPFHPGFFLKN